MSDLRILKKWGSHVSQIIGNLQSLNDDLINCGDFFFENLVAEHDLRKMSQHDPIGEIILNFFLLNKSNCGSMLLLGCSEWGCGEVGFLCNSSEHGGVPCPGDASVAAHCGNACDRLDRRCLRSRAPGSLLGRFLLGPIQDHHHFLLRIRRGKIVSTFYVHHSSEMMKYVLLDNVVFSLIWPVGQWIITFLLIYWLV